MQTLQFQPPNITIAASGTPLLTAGNLSYLGAYKLPVESGWTYGYERRIHFADGKIFVTGTDVNLTLAELTPPATLGSGAYSGLPAATTVQPLAGLHGRIANWSTSGLDRIGGLCKLTDGRLCVSYYEMYDANSGATNSHVLLDGTLAAGTVTPLRTLTGAPHAGYVGGHMQRVPAEHQAKLGAAYLTGQGSISILARTSYGFSLFGFNPAALASGNTPASPLLYYNEVHPLGPYDGQSSAWNSTCKFAGFAVVRGYRTVLFFGRLGTGPTFYGVPQSTDPTAPNYDPAVAGNGFHAYPYRYQVWAYDLNDLEAVRLGIKQPWEPMPYATWELTIPTPWPARWIGGVGYDEATNRITVCQQDDGGDNGGWPIFHVFQVN